MIARAIAARCFWPPERSLGRREANCSTGARSTSSSASRTFASRLGVALGQLVDLQRVRERGLQRHPRVQRRVRVLEDHLQVPALRAQLTLGQADELLAAQLHAAAGRAHEPEQRAAERRLARARLADQAEHLALVEVERDAVDGLHRAAAAAGEARAEAPVQREVDLEVADLDQRLAWRPPWRVMLPPPRPAPRARAGPPGPRGCLPSRAASTPSGAPGRS